MKKNTIKMITTILIATVLFVALVNVSFVSAGGISFQNYDASDAVNDAQDNTGTAGTAEAIVQAIMTIVQVIGVGVAIIMLIVLAIKYISAAPGDKAEIKKHAVVYVVGATVLFAAAGILGIIKNFAKMFTENGYSSGSSAPTSV